MRRGRNRKRTILASTVVAARNTPTFVPAVMIRLRKKRYSPSWVDAVPSVGSNLSEEMPGGHDESDALAEGGGGGERKTTPFVSERDRVPNSAIAWCGGFLA